MTKEEFQEALVQFRKYNDINFSIEQLRRGKERLKQGVDRIVGEDSLGCKREIDCRDYYRGFRKKLTNTILRFYDSEIERLQKQLEELGKS